MKTNQDIWQVQGIRIISKIVSFLFLTAVVVLVSYGVYALWDTLTVIHSASPDQYAKYKPDADDDGMSFEELCRLNPEVLGWLTIYGTNIDYPLVQTTDNNKYLSHDVLGDYSLAGSIFLDYRNKKDFSDFNTIIHGHHMDHHVMFGDLDLFQDEEFFDTHLYGNLYYGKKDHGIRIFAFTEADAYTSGLLTPAVTGTRMQRIYLEEIQKKAKYFRDFPENDSARIVVLSTCTGNTTNGRHLLIGEIMDETYTDEFQQK